MHNCALNHENHGIDFKIGLEYLQGNSISENECILLVEGNHVTGENQYSRFSPFTND